MPFHSQANQDEFVLQMTRFKRNGFFLEIGSYHPIEINNSYILEKEYGWRGIMVEFDPSFLPLYEAHRPTATHVIQDATTIDYQKLLQRVNAPTHIDYLQIDLVEGNGSTLQTLKRLDESVFDKYTVGVITFEHDIYASNVFNTQVESRAIFEKRGYRRVFSDVCFKGNPFEDWYVHSSLLTDADVEPWKPTEKVDASEILRRIQANPPLS